MLKISGLRTRCGMNPINFPFDTQNCSIIIGSWQYDTSRINLTAKVEQDYFADSTTNPIWNFLRMSASEIYSKFRSPIDETYDADETNSTFSSNDMSFNIIIARNPAYYMLNNIYPCFILNLVSLLAFFLPFTSQLTISINIFIYKLN